MQQLTNEIMTKRDTVHDFTDTLLTHVKLAYILDKGPNFIPTEHENNVHKIFKETKVTIIEALK